MDISWLTHMQTADQPLQHTYEIPEKLPVIAAFGNFDADRQRIFFGLENGIHIFLRGAMV